MVDLNVWYLVNETEAVLAAGVAAAILAFWGIITQRALAARQATIQLLRESEADKDLYKANATFHNLARQPEGLGKWGHEQYSQSKEARAIRMILNEYELIAIGIQRGILDDTTYRRWAKSQVIKNWRLAAPYVLAVRARTNNDALFHEFEEMARWYKGGPNMPKRRFFLRRFF